MAKTENFGWLKAELISSATQTSRTDSSKTYQLMTVRLEKQHKPRGGQPEILKTDVTFMVFGQAARVVREAAPGSIMGIRYNLWSKLNGQYSNLQVNVEDVAVLYVPQASGGQETRREQSHPPERTQAPTEAPAPTGNGAGEDDVPF
jgi:hypothetical protein